MANNWTAFGNVSQANFNNIGTIYWDMYYMFNIVNTKPNILNLETLNWTQGLSSPNSAGEGSCLVALRDSIIVLGGSNFRYVEMGSWANPININMADAQRTQS